MEAMLVFLAFSVFIFGGMIMVQLYVLYKKRKEIDATRHRLEDLLVRDCSNAISRYRMSFMRVPKNNVGYLTRVKLSHEAQMSEFIWRSATVAPMCSGMRNFPARKAGDTSRRLS